MKNLYDKLKLDERAGVSLPAIEEIRTFIETLPASYQQIFFLRYELMMTVPEIAKKLNYSSSVIYRKQSSLIYRLQRKFNPALFEKALAYKKSAEVFNSFFHLPVIAWRAACHSPENLN